MTKFNVFRKSVGLLTYAIIFGLLILITGLVWLGVVSVFGLLF